MTPLTLAWAAICFWTSVSSQSPEKTLLVRYPKISDSETLNCDCYGLCDEVFWFRSGYDINGSDIFQFLFLASKIDRVSYRPEMTATEKDHFKISARESGSTVTFSLRIINVTEKDAGIYSCVFRNQNLSLWRPGFQLRPGESPPTSPPTSPPVTKSPRQINPICRCTKNKNNHSKGCGTMVFWPLVGILLGLAVALISTLYYFSRLPRKCQHQFAKKR